MQAVIFTGIQAVGKSTFYKEHFFHTHVRISMDMLRTRHREAALLRACIEMKQPFVVDNTNPTRAERSRYIAPARAAGFTVTGYYFRSRVSEALQRNRERQGAACIPEKGIFGTAGRLEVPRFDEGFDALLYVQITGAGAFALEEWQDDI